MKKVFLQAGGSRKIRVIIPLQEPLTANLPPISALESSHQPFPSDAPTFEGLLVAFNFVQS